MSASKPPHIALVAGELSGDTLGAGLVTALREALPDARIEGVGGPKMGAAGCGIVFDCEELAVMGLVEVLRHLPRLLRRRSELVRRWREQPPDVFIGIDAPDFNLGLARRLRSSGVATVQYVCPSVWAWREGRVRTLAAALDHVLCLLPFEPAFLGRHGIDATFVGHPLAATIDAARPRAPLRAEFAPAGEPLVAVLPGSRGGEVGRLAATFIDTVRVLRRRQPSLVAVAAMATQRTADIFRAAGAAEAGIDVVVGRTGDVLTAADAVLVASGTAALETALHARPMVVAYKLSPMTYRIINLFKLVRTRFVSLPNILAERSVVPEFIQDAATPDALAGALAPLIDDPVARRRQLDEFATLRDTLSMDTNAQAAAVVQTLAAGPHRPND